MTKSVDKEIKLCNCEGTYIEENEFEGNVTYSAQKIQKEMLSFKLKMLVPL